MRAVELRYRAAASRWLAAALSVAFPTVLAAQSPASGPPTFVAGTCPATLAETTGLEAGWIRCGTVTVPQNRATPGARLAPVALPVVIFETPSSRGRTPLFFLAGGPGEAAIDAVSQVFIPSPLGQLTLRERPIVTMNQRGIGGTAEGALDLGVLRYRKRATRDEAIAAIVDSAKRVVRRARAANVQLANFTTQHTVEDIADVLKALGHTKAVLFGTSYGTRVSLEFMRTYPAQVESAILDGVATPQWLEAFEPEAHNRRLATVATRLVEDCERNPTCQAEYAGLGDAARLLARIDAPPVRIVSAVSPGEWFSIELRGPDLLTAVGAFAGTEYARALPQSLEELARGDTTRRALSPALVMYAVRQGVLARAAGPDYPLIYHVVLCGDVPAGVPQAGGRGICDALGVPFRGPEAVTAVSSDTPTLLLSSGYDAQTPREIAQDAARTLPKSHQVHFPAVGHLAYSRALSASCVAVIVHAFLLDPSRQPPDPCSTTLAPSFLSRSAELVTRAQQR